MALMALSKRQVKQTWELMSARKCQAALLHPLSLTGLDP